MNEAALERAVIALRGMAYEHRLHILLLLREGEQTPTSLAHAVPAEATAIAHHLRSLRDARLIVRRRHGRQMFYSLHSEAIGRFVTEIYRHAEEAGARRAPASDQF
ncbi:DNA-binding transcriptional ArsR family regulator [Actinoplanes tereljensis]|uniref:HTH arsR-type domain-containing protein n=1 Tax=Paractinoplanes tereljensis TaxID=571912 RepID=A0A919TV47_9ACTN|nr:helix-turn-helix domain-containing protein [Actinoplanes tereljensis]GIF23541.1 hypothetical protein Ate02nite_62710 [Actinoplanes tereljensis]